MNRCFVAFLRINLAYKALHQYTCCVDSQCNTMSVGKSWFCRYKSTTSNQTIARAL